MTWLPILRYTGFWDVPRRIFLEYQGVGFVLDCEFDEIADDYAQDYKVYRLPDGTIELLLSHGLTVNEAFARGTAIGSVKVSDVKFDITKRKQVNESVFGRLELA